MDGVFWMMRKTFRRWGGGKLCFMCLCMLVCFCAICCNFYNDQLWKTLPQRSGLCLCTLIKSYIFLFIYIRFLFLVLINLASLYSIWRSIVLKMISVFSIFSPQPLRSKASSCLLHTDPRSRYLVRLPAKLPGMHYSADEQCQILFGTNATFCTNMEVGGKTLLFSSIQMFSL